MSPRALRPPDPPLTDGEIALRRWREADVPAIVEMCRDAAIQRFTRVPSPYRVIDARWFLREQDDAWLEGRAAAFAIVAADEPDRVLGSIEVRLDAEHRADAGYMVAASARGRGAAARALALVAGWACGTLAVARIEVHVAPENGASLTVPERAGFTREGVARDRIVLRDGRHDAVVFALLPRDLSP